VNGGYSAEIFISMHTFYFNLFCPYYCNIIQNCNYYKICKHLGTLSEILCNYITKFKRAQNSSFHYKRQINLAHNMPGGDCTRPVQETCYPYTGYVFLLIPFKFTIK
jgi:hypothetical protein